LNRLVVNKIGKINIRTLLDAKIIQSGQVIELDTSTLAKFRYFYLFPIIN